MYWMMAFSPTIANVAYALKQSNLAGKVIVVLLFVGSVFVWSVMVTKFMEMSQAKRSSRRFLSAFRKQGHPAGLFLRRQTFEGTPLHAVYEQVCRELAAALEARGAQPEDLFMGVAGGKRYPLSPHQVGAIRNVAERTVADKAVLMESSMGFLASATTTAPFLGLLGTVWGVMDSFGGMAVTGSAMLSAVAPGISGALLTTVVGLLVALPSAIGYNMLSADIRRLTVEMDNFAQELVSAVELHYLEP
jgi:biopolymer transport protein ExbB/TolQ